MRVDRLCKRSRAHQTEERSQYRQCQTHSSRHGESSSASNSSEEMKVNRRDTENTEVSTKSNIVFILCLYISGDPHSSPRGKRLPPPGRPVCWKSLDSMPPIQNLD